MKTRKTVLAGLGVAFLSTSAISGLTSPFPVEVDLTERTGRGDMVTARYSDNKTEYIGCGIRKFSDGEDGVLSWGFCQAVDRDDERITCFTQDPELLDAVSSSGGFTYVTFSWDEENTCTQIGFSSNSFYLPVGLDSNENN